MGWLVRAVKPVFYGDIIVHPKTKQILQNTQTLYDPRKEGTPTDFTIRGDKQRDYQDLMDSESVVLLREVADEDQVVVIPMTAAAPVTPPIGDRGLAAAHHPGMSASMEEALGDKRKSKTRASDKEIG